jgi:pimeloyl-ACP methyl ester carboxylesterase
MASALHIDVSGPEAGDRVLLLHSSGLSSRQWRRLAPLLAGRGFRVLAPDLAGHGASPPVLEPTPFTYLDEVDNVREILADHGPVHVVGHSYGGLIAVLAAIGAGEAVRSSILYDPVAFGVLDAVADAGELGDLRAVGHPWRGDGGAADDEASHERWLTAFVDYWGGEGAWLALREDVRAEFRRTGWVVHEEVTTLLTDETRAAAYGAVRGPVTLLTGERSPRAAHAVAARLAAALPRATRVVVPGAGHMGPISHSDAVNAIILSALLRPNAEG